MDESCPTIFLPLNVNSRTGYIYGWNLPVHKTCIAGVLEGTNVGSSYTSITTSGLLMLEFLHYLGHPGRRNPPESLPIFSMDKL